MEDHRSQCPLEPVECPFAEAGCKVDIRRQQFENHMTTSQQQHLMLLMIDRTQLKREWKEMKTELKEVKAKLSKTETERDKIEVKLHETEDRLAFCEASNPANKLKKSGDSMKITMPRFSEYRRSCKVWYSPPFYYGKGYKMCLAVHANGVGAWEGAGTHVSVAILHLRGEYDNQLTWPLECDRLHLFFNIEINDGVYNFEVCTLDQHPNNERVQIECRINFCSLNNEKILHMVNDCLTFQVKCNGCLLKVEIITL
jgi:hypothetical protein